MQTVIKDDYFTVQNPTIEFVEAFSKIMVIQTNWRNGPPGGETGGLTRQTDFVVFVDADDTLGDLTSRWKTA